MLHRCWESEVLRFEWQVLYWLLSPHPSFLYVIMTHFLHGWICWKNLPFCVWNKCVHSLRVFPSPKAYKAHSSLNHFSLSLEGTQELTRKLHVKRLWKAQLYTRHLYHTSFSSRGTGIMVEGEGTWRDCRSQRLLKTRTQCFLSTTGQLHTWIHDSLDSTHKTHLLASGRRVSFL